LLLFAASLSAADHWLAIESACKVWSDQPWKFQGQVQYYVEQPDAFGPEWLFKLTITRVIKNPFTK
jgi:hypothetical protein